MRYVTYAGAAPDAVAAAFHRSRTHLGRSRWVRDPSDWLGARLVDAACHVTAEDSRRSGSGIARRFALPRGLFSAPIIPIIGAKVNNIASDA